MSFTSILVMRFSELIWISDDDGLGKRFISDLEVVSFNPVKEQEIGSAL